MLFHRQRALRFWGTGTIPVQPRSAGACQEGEEPRHIHSHVITEPGMRMQTYVRKLRGPGSDTTIGSSCRVRANGT